MTGALLGAALSPPWKAGGFPWEVQPEAPRVKGVKGTEFVADRRSCGGSLVTALPQSEVITESS